MWQVHNEKGESRMREVGKAGGDWSSQLFSTTVKDSPFIFITIESQWTILDWVGDSDGKSDEVMYLFQRSLW